MAMKTKAIADRIRQSIFLIRGQKVILDAHLAELYSVPTRILIQAVTRNASRFPRDFMFRLSKREFANLRSQIEISSLWGGRRTLRLHGTRRGHAFQRAAQQARGCSQRGDHACVRLPSAGGYRACRARAAHRRVGGALRRKVSGCLRCDSDLDCSTREATETNRIPLRLTAPVATSPPGRCRRRAAPASSRC